MSSPWLDQPIASYDGSTNGMAATRPKGGRKVRTDTDAAKRYRSFLTEVQDRIAGLVDAEVLQRFSVTLNGFSAKLTPTQAQRLERTTGVVSVVKDTLHTATDDRNSTDYLRLNGKSGVWESLGGSDVAGEGIVVGVLDTGIWPESKSFAGKPLEHGRAEGRRGLPAATSTATRSSWTSPTAAPSAAPARPARSGPPTTATAS